MYIENIIKQLRSDLKALLNTSALFERSKAKLLVSSIKGLIILFEEKLGISEYLCEGEEELTNGNIFKLEEIFSLQIFNIIGGCDFEDKNYLYAYAEMPNGNKKWFQKTYSSKANWKALNYDPSDTLCFCKK